MRWHRVTGGTRGGEVTPGWVWVPQTSFDGHPNTDGGGTSAPSTTQATSQRCPAPRDSMGYVPTQPLRCRHRGYAWGPAPRTCPCSRPHGPQRAAGHVPCTRRPVTHLPWSPSCQGTRSCPPPPLQPPPCHARADTPFPNGAQGPHCHLSPEPGKNRFRQAGSGIRGPGGGPGLNSRPHTSGSRADARRAGTLWSPNV